MGIYIFDLDGTLSDNRWRRKLLEEKEINFAGFEVMCEEDKCHKNVVRIHNILAEKFHKIIYMTARKEKHRKSTLRWLNKNVRLGAYEDRISEAPLYMRKDDDNRDDTLVKMGFISDLLSTYDKSEIYGIFDDRTKVVKMWQSLGLPVFQVNHFDG